MSSSAAELSSASSASSSTSKSSASSASASLATVLQKHSVDAPKVPSTFFNKHRTVIIIVGVLAFLALLWWLSKSSPGPAPKRTVTFETPAEPTTTTPASAVPDIHDVIAQLYISGTDAIGEPEDFRGTTVTGRLQGIDVEPAACGVVSVIVVKDPKDVLRPNILELIRSETFRPAIVILGFSGGDTSSLVSDGFVAQNVGNNVVLLPTTVPAS